MPSRNRRDTWLLMCEKQVRIEKENHTNFLLVSEGIEPYKGDFDLQHISFQTRKNSTYVILIHRKSLINVSQCVVIPNTQN